MAKKSQLKKILEIIGDEKWPENEMLLWEFNIDPDDFKERLRKEAKRRIKRMVYGYD